MRAIGVSSIALATMVLTATDVRSANNNWCAIYTKPENENCTFHRAKLPRQLMEATASSQRLDRAPRETRPVAPHRAAAAGRAPAHEPRAPHKP